MAGEFGIFNTYATQYNINGLLRDGSSVSGYFVVQNAPDDCFTCDNSISLLAQDIRVTNRTTGETFSYVYGIDDCKDPTVFSANASRDIGIDSGAFTTYRYQITSFAENNLTFPPATTVYEGVSVLSLEFNARVNELTGAITARMTSNSGQSLGTADEIRDQNNYLDGTFTIAEVDVSYISAFNTTITTLRATSSTVICYAKGTFIATARGMVSVEKLKIGDLILTISGKYEPLKWLGFRTVDCKRHPNQQEAHPVRIAKDAFGLNQPVRDLYLSPLHSVYVDGILIPAIDLVNGDTVTQEVRSKVTYFHVELPTHNAIYAEGLTAESYLDDNNRDFFVDRTSGQVMNMNAQFAEKQFVDMTSAEIWASKGFAKVMRNGPQVDAVRNKLKRQHTHQEAQASMEMAA
jgi:hypothetical protein